jgi:hypothetical protein
MVTITRTTMGQLTNMTTATVMCMARIATTIIDEYQQ